MQPHLYFEHFWEIEVIKEWEHYRIGDSDIRVHHHGVTWTTSSPAHIDVKMNITRPFPDLNKNAHNLCESCLELECNCQEEYKAESARVQGVILQYLNHLWRNMPHEVTGDERRVTGA